MGFPGPLIDVVTWFVRCGYEAWFFDGDRDAAYTAWQTSHPNFPAALYQFQLAGLVSVDAELAPLFGRRRIETVSAGPSHAPLGRLLTLIVGMPGRP